MSAPWRRNSGQVDGGTMAIAVRRKPKLEDAAGVQLPVAAEPKEGGWLHYGDCRAPEAGPGDARPRLRPLPLPRSLAHWRLAAVLHASAEWWPGTTSVVCGRLMLPFDANCAVWIRLLLPNCLILHCSGGPQATVPFPWLDVLLHSVGTWSATVRRIIACDEVLTTPAPALKELRYKRSLQ